MGGGGLCRLYIVAGVMPKAGFGNVAESFRCPSGIFGKEEGTLMMSCSAVR